MTGSLTLTGAASNFQVQGTGTFLSTVSITNDLAVDTDTLFVDVSTDRVGINVGVNPSEALHVGGNILLSGIAQPTIFFNGSSDAGIDMAIRATPEALDFYEPEDGNKIQFQIYDDTGVNSPQGYHVNGTRILDQARNLTNIISMTIDTANDNSGAPLYFLGSSSARNFSVGNQIGFNDCFEITPSSNNGGTSWKGTPALLIDGSENAIAINTSAFSGVDPENNQTRNYKLNVQGDMNINGQLFQNNSEFVTSRWTEASNQADIYRLSRVGINRVDPTYQLHISGDTNIENGALYANGVRQWIDSYGIFKSNSNTVAENITIPANINCVSAGPITIANGYTVIINSGGNWAIV